MMRRYMSRVIALCLLVYLFLAMLPLSALWYTPGIVVVKDGVVGTPPAIEFWRDIKRPTRIRYSVVVRPANNAATACEGGGGPWHYQPVRGALIGKDLAWWVGGPQCNNLEPGLYWMQTCWTAVAPMEALLPEFLVEMLGWLLPPKTVCVPNTSENRNGYSFEIKEKPE